MKKIQSFIKIIPTIAILVLLPVVASAGGYGNFAGIKQILTGVTDIINGFLVPIVFALAFLMFLWGMFTTFILGGTDSTKQEEGRHLMLYSILAFIVMVCIWGIVNLVANGFGLNNANTVKIPVIPQTIQTN